MSQQKIRRKRKAKKKWRKNTTNCIKSFDVRLFIIDMLYSFRSYAFTIEIHIWFLNSALEKKAQNTKRNERAQNEKKCHSQCLHVSSMFVFVSSVYSVSFSYMGYLLQTRKEFVLFSLCMTLHFHKFVHSDRFFFLFVSRLSYTHILHLVAFLCALHTLHTQYELCKHIRTHAFSGWCLLVFRSEQNSKTTKFVGNFNLFVLPFSRPQAPVEHFVRFGYKFFFLGHISSSNNMNNRSSHCIATNSFQCRDCDVEHEYRSQKSRNWNENWHLSVLYRTNFSVPTLLIRI